MTEMLSVKMRQF